MKLDRAKKQAFVDELAGKLATAECVYLTDFTGLNVERMTQLRSKLRASSVEYVVVKNTLARRALAGTAAAGLDELLEGASAFALGQADAVAAAKALTDFSKDGDLPRIKGGVVAGQIMGAAEIRRLAMLPRREVLLAQLVGSMKSPLNGFVLVLTGVLGKFVRTVDALRAQKAERGENGSAPASPEPEAAVGQREEAPAASEEAGESPEIQA
jgi:large subunit ribosomal protein L10